LVHYYVFEPYQADFEDVLETMRDSVQVYARNDMPTIWPGKAPGDEFAFYGDPEEGYYLSYPMNWQIVEDDGVITFVPPGEDEPAASELQLGAITVYPPSSSLGEPDPGGEMITAAERMDALWQWAASPPIKNMMLASNGSSFRLLGKDHASGFFVATDASRGDQPLYGFLGLITNGFSTVKMVSWFDDPYTHRQEWLDVFDSIGLTQTANLARDEAVPLSAGEQHTAVLDSNKQQLFAFEAAVGDKFALLAQMDASEEALEGAGQDLLEIVVYDAQNQLLGYSQMVWPREPELLLFTAESSGEHILVVTPLVAETSPALTLHLLPVAAGEESVIDVKHGDLYDTCQEFGYAGLENKSDQIAVFAQTLGYAHHDVGLRLKVFNGSRQLLQEEVAYNKEDLPENYEVEQIGDWQIYTYAGLPIVTDLATPQDGRLIVQICEPGLQPVDYELIILALPE
jgi:hypothetical protein